MSPSLPARGLLALIQLYKWTLSPLIGRECRYLPTCSSYAADAVRAHGAWAGSWMAAARLCRCHPWGGTGWDPVCETAPRVPFWAPWRYGDWAWRKNPSPLRGGVGEGGDGERADAAGKGAPPDRAARTILHAPPPYPPPQGGRDAPF